MSRDPRSINWTGDEFCFICKMAQKSLPGKYNPLRWFNPRILILHNIARDLPQVEDDKVMVARYFLDVVQPNCFGDCVALHVTKWLFWIAILFACAWDTFFVDYENPQDLLMIPTTVLFLYLLNRFFSFVKNSHRTGTFFLFIYQYKIFFFLRCIIEKKFFSGGIITNFFSQKKILKNLYFKAFRMEC